MACQLHRSSFPTLLGSEEGFFDLRRKTQMYRMLLRRLEFIASIAVRQADCHRSCPDESVAREAATANNVETSTGAWQSASAVAKAEGSDCSTALVRCSFQRQPSAKTTTGTNSNSIQTFYRSFRRLSSLLQGLVCQAVSTIGRMRMVWPIIDHLVRRKYVILGTCDERAMNIWAAPTVDPGGMAYISHIPAGL